jgi:hypothetical protein
MSIFDFHFWQGLLGALIVIPSFLILRTLVILLGFIMVPIAVLSGAYVKVESSYSNKHQPIYLFTWKIMRPWQNYEDGFAWNTYKDFNNLLLNSIYWSCIRNPANGLRFLPITGPKLDIPKIGFVGSFGSVKDYYEDKISGRDSTWVLRYDEATPQWFFAWQNFYANLFVHFKFRSKLYRFWIGWKIYPAAKILGTPEYQKHGVGFATQFKQVKRPYFNKLPEQGAL